MQASVITGGDFRGNLIQNDDATYPCDYPSGDPSGVVSMDDPQLGPMQNNGGFTPTMAIPSSSPAWNAADASTSLATDQRGESRPQMGGYDIGAFELCTRLGQPCIISAGTAQTTTLTMQGSPSGAGVTDPPTGTDNEVLGSVTVITAFPNAGYCFSSWTGDGVTDQSNASTSVLMDQPRTVTANFSQCAMNVSSSVAVARGPFLYNPITHLFTQTITITNTSANTITGPISLVLDNLGTNATLSNVSGATDSLEPPAGSPYIDSDMNLAPGQNVKVTLQFTDPTQTTITYNTRVLAGPGPR
jgi:Divergent InlB B-repeat domain